MNAKTTILALAAFAFTATPAAAEPSAYLAAQTAQSLEEGLGQRSLFLLKAKPPKGGAKKRFAALDGALDSLLTSELRGAIGSLDDVQADRSSTIAHTPSGAYLEVDKDASSFRFRIDPATARSQASTQKLDADLLETKGRELLAGALAEYVPTSEREEIVFLGTRYLIEDEGNIETGEITESIVGHIALFGRTVDGNLVLGPGSKAALAFTGRANLSGFDIDWPIYKILGKPQQTVSIEEIWNRFETFAEQEVPRPGHTQNQSLAVSRFECGYVDLGATRRKGAKIQAGCFAHVDGRSTDGAFRIAYGEVMPIGDRVQKDRNWPATYVVQGKRARPCRPTDPGCTPPEEVSRFAAPFFVTTMTHMEGDWDDHLPGNEARFEIHAAQLRFAAELAQRNDATMTFESEIPFSSAQVIYGDNVMQELYTDYGQGVGTHCDIWPRIDVGTGIDYQTQLEGALGVPAGSDLFAIGFDTELAALDLADFADLHGSDFSDALVDRYVESFLVHYGFNTDPGGDGPGDTLAVADRSIVEWIAEWKVRKTLMDQLIGADLNLGCSGGGGLSDWVQAAKISGFSFVDGIVGYHQLSTLPSSRPPGWTNAAIFSGLYHDPVPLPLSERVHPVFLSDALDLQEDSSGEVLMSPGSIGRLDSFDGTTGELSHADLAGAMVALEAAVAEHDPSRVGKATFYLPPSILTEANEPLIEKFFTLINEQFIDTDRASWASQSEVYQAVVAWEAERTGG